MPLLNVTYSGGKLNITGGDNNGADVTIIYGQNATITWNRVGNNFKFKDLTLDPSTGPFSQKSVADGSVSIVDNDDNRSGKDVSYEYTITIKDSTGALKKFDPKVINKSEVGPGLLARFAKAKTTRKKATKRTTRASRT